MNNDEDDDDAVSTGIEQPMNIDAVVMIVTG